MSKSANILGGLLAVVFGAIAINYVSGGVNLAKQLIVTFKDVTGLRIQGLTVVFNIRLKIVNPSESKLDIYSMSSDLFYGSDKIANPYIINGVTIAPRSENVLTIPVTISGVDVVSVVMGFINGTGDGKKIKPFEFVAVINTNFGSIPIKETFKLM